MSAYTELDDLSRDPNDDAYHCPKCEAPFTRRSNLRRHYTIHTRSLAFKCHLCCRRFARSDELNYHTEQCERNLWNGMTDGLLRATTCLEANKDLDGRTGFVSSLTGESNAPSPTSQPTESLQQDPYPVELRQSQDDDQEFSDFLSSFTSLPPPDMPQLSEMSFYDERQPRGHPTHPNITRPGSSFSMSSILSSSASPSLTSAANLPESISRLSYRRGSYSRSDRNGRRRTKERPVYTRRQVDDMLDAVSKCFVGAIEEIFKRPHTHDRLSGSSFDSSVSPAAVSRIGSDELNALGFNDMLPQLLCGFQDIDQAHCSGRRDS